MNLLHLKYAVEVEKTRSISKAAENLHMGQPNLSRAIKELEESLGITIFKRTSKGILLTPQGEEFLQYAKGIISQVEQVESLYQDGKKMRQTFTLSAPRASYIADAFGQFVQELGSDLPAEVFYRETNSEQAISSILQSDYRLGIIRYQSSFEPHFKALMREKGISSQVLLEFSYIVLTSRCSPLAQKDTVALADLDGCVEIAHADQYVPSLTRIDAKKAELSENVEKHIYVYERGSQMDLLSRLPNTFMWSSPVPRRLLDLYGLTERPCPANRKKYRDVLIYRKGYHFSDQDKRFIDLLCKNCPGQNP